jgi:DNA-binding response OmpR family regulator
VAGFMTKPFKPEELLENVQMALTRNSRTNG